MHWDFALILIFLATAVPLLGRRRIRQLMQVPQTTKRDRLALYASTVAFQWIAVAVILWRTNAHGIAAARLGLAVPNVGLTIAVSVVLAGLVFSNQILSLRRLTLHPAEVQGILPHLALKIFPQDGVERLAFFAVVVTVSVCEELIYRGFAERVFEDWARGSALAGVLCSAALFAIAHLYQGRRGLISTLIVGLVFSSVRVWTGSLIALVVAHFVTDLAAGFMAPSRFRAALAQTGEKAVAPEPFA
jgi:uncharacterized protein